MKSCNITKHAGKIGIQDRLKLLGQCPLTLWLTGLSGSGKSTLAYGLEERLIKTGVIAYVLDGDNIRHGLSSNLGFSEEDRTENIRRVAEVAALMNDAGLIVITAFISPLRSDRAMAREIIGNSFMEVHVSTPLEICEMRDPKGLYVKARRGEIQNFTGITAPYENPDSAELTLHTDLLTPEDACDVLLNATLARTKVNQHIFTPRLNMPK